MRMSLRERSLCLVAIMVAFSLALCLEARCQSAAPQSYNANSPIVFPTVLSAFSQQPLSVAPFAYLRMAQCDDSGRMFFAAAPGGAVGGVTYLSISADGEEQANYDIPKYIKDYPYNASFSVTPDGMLQLLFVVPGQPVRWLKFDKQGALSNVVQLPVPSDISVRSFATTSQGYLLLLGYHPLTDTHAKTDGEAYRAIFAPNGNLVANLKTAKSGMQSNGTFADSPEEPATVEGEQFFWITSSGKSMVVMDTDGNVVRTLRLPGARPGDQAVGLRISGDMALVTYINFKATPHESYLLLNATTGLEYGLYLPPPDARGSLTCFQSSRGFTFLNFSKGHLRLVQSRLP